MKLFLIQALALTAITSALAQSGDKPFAQSGDDPFVYIAPGNDPKVDKTSPKNISICFEAFSLPLAEAAQWQRQSLNDPELYAKLLAGLKNKATKQEIFTVIKCRAGQRVLSKAAIEEIYPTEFEPAEIVRSLGIAVSPETGEGDTTPTPDPTKLQNAATLTGSADIFRTPSTPVSFETRLIGHTLEAEATLSSDPRWIDVQLNPQSIGFGTRSAWGQGVSKAEMPTIENQSFSTGLTIHVGRPHLVGTMNRPPDSELDPDSANRVWFAFVTGTISKY